jgi:hypothetical protein
MKTQKHKSAGCNLVEQSKPPHGHERRSFHLTDGYFELAILAKANLL